MRLTTHGESLAHKRRNSRNVGAAGFIKPFYYAQIK
jgi:hypothetical protein